MSENADTSNAIIRPPIAWAIAILAGIGADWLYPLRFLPASVPRIWVGSGVFAVALALAIWAIVTVLNAGSRVETNKPTELAPVVWTDSANDKWRPAGFAVSAA